MTDAPASASWHAEIVPTRRPWPLVALRWLPALAMAWFAGDGDEWPGHDVVVSEQGTGREVMRLVGKGIVAADESLQLVRADLDGLTREEFLREWGAD